MKIQKILVLLIFCTSFILTGCALTKPDKQILPGTSWEVKGYHNGQSIINVLNTGKTLTANFGADAKLGGNAGCNNYSSTYTAQDADHSLILERIITTRMACSLAGLMQQEQQFLAALSTVSRYQMAGDTLILKTAEDKEAILLSKK